MYEAGSKYIEMPMLVNTLADISKLGCQIEIDLAVRLEISASRLDGLTDNIRTRMSDAASNVGLVVREKDGQPVNRGTHVVEVQGSFLLVSAFYAQIPWIIDTSKVSHRIREDPMHGRGLEFKFLDAGKECWIGSVYVCILWIKTNNEKAPHLKGFIITELFQSCKSLVTSQKQLNYVNCETTVFPSHNWLQVSLSSIHDQTHKFRLKEWRVDSRNTNVNHEDTNIRFNININKNQRLLDVHPRQLEVDHFSLDQNLSHKPHNREIYQESTSSGAMMKHFSKKRIFETDTTQGRFILRVQCIDWRKIGQKKVCNLFTNYGNIDTAICTSDGSQMYLCYGSNIGLDNAIACLNGFPVDGRPIMLTRIDKDTLYYYLSREKYILFAPTKRFSSKGLGVPNKINPVSRTLHVTYHHDSEDRILSDNELLIALSQFGQPIRIKRESSKKKKNMWFVEYLNKVIGVNVIMKQHNQPYQGGTLRISFTKTL